jgi:hypothetical protein
MLAVFIPAKLYKQLQFVIYTCSSKLDSWTRLTSICGQSYARYPPLEWSII